jgi:hypothetical protein
MSARKVRDQIVDILRPVLASASFNERSDQSWVFATMANALFALGEDVEGEQYEALFLGGGPPAWQVETYQKGKADMLAGRKPQT